MIVPSVGCILGEAPVDVWRDPGGQTFGSDGRPRSRERTCVAANVSASVQPLTGKDWQILDLGGRRVDYRKIYSETELRSGDNQARPAFKGDHVSKGDDTFEVMTVEDFSESPYPHWKAIARRIDESATDEGP